MTAEYDRARALQLNLYKHYHLLAYSQRKCTDDKELAKKFTFLTTKGKTFEVTEFKDGTFDVGLPKDDKESKKES